VKHFKHHLVCTGALQTCFNDQAYGTVPTKALGPAAFATNTNQAYSGGPFHVFIGELNSLHWRFDTEAQETYRLVIYESDLGGAGSLRLEMHKLYDSGVGMNPNEEYYVDDIVRPFILKYPGLFFYLVDWSGDEGDVEGYLSVGGYRDEVE